MSNNLNAFDKFKEEHPFILNSILIAIATIALFYIGLLFIDVFTNHGQQRQVPDVRNLTLSEAAARLESAGFKWDISDSTNYVEMYRPGTVIDQEPKANSFVKPIRVIYLKLNAMNARMVAMPKLQETSIRQGLALLRSMGFKNVEVDSVASPYGGLILQATVNNHQVAPGKQVSVNSLIRLVVGDGSIDNMNPDSILDSNTIDSIEQRNYEEAVEQYSSILK
ncbi:MAG: PASTA domain-containing protein [Muribaculaceae bacterium]|nr:PASTA domain-containing protein [Muribaculaceae bacterium]